MNTKEFKKLINKVNQEIEKIEEKGEIINVCDLAIFSNSIKVVYHKQYEHNKDCKTIFVK